MINLVTFILFFVSISYSYEAVKTSDAEHATAEIAQHYEYYGIIDYTVKTSDGYLLKTYQIMGGPKSKPVSGKSVVMLLHPYFTSSIDWVRLGPEKSLAFTLVDEGYEVWLPNIRGNTLSRKHVTLSPDDPKFWDYTMHEVGVYDLPALIDFALEMSGQKKLHFVGYSGSVMAFLALQATNGTYADKIRTAHFFSPAAYFTNVASPVFKALSTIPTSAALKLIGPEFAPDRSFWHMFSSFCRINTSFTNQICRNSLFSMAGFCSKHIELSDIPVIFEYIPAGVSTLSVLHISQLVRSKNFQRFNYGPEKNLEKYGQSAPPVYDLSKVNVPVALWYGNCDWLAATEDVERMAEELPNVISKRLMPTNWNHLDFLWGGSAKKDLYESVVQVMKQNE